MAFIAEKDPGLIPQILSLILDECVNGVTLADPDLDDMPIVYANKAFETITGYSREDVIGRNCRFLQGDDRNQEGIKLIEEAIKNKSSVVVTLRNYKKSGELFYNSFKIIPLFDRNDRLIYFLGVQYDITQQVLDEKQIEDLKQQLSDN
ncbi:MAG: hypothetical protein Kow0065_09560 [Methylomicrobium sp.]